MKVQLLKKVENIVAKGEIAHLGNLSFCHNVFKSRLLHSRQKASIYGKGLSHNDLCQSSVRMKHQAGIQN